MTDTSANLPTVWLKENDVEAIAFSYFIGDLECFCSDTAAFSGHAYYSAIRNGSKVRTSLISPAKYADAFRKPLEKGEDLLFVGMSSGISGSFQSAVLAADQLRGEFPEQQICLVDSIGASLGEGLLVMDAVELRTAGHTVSETAEILENRKIGMCQVFTVDDLMHLRSTGRLSNARAVIGTVLNIKPLLKGDGTGHIVSFGKVRGRRKSIEAIAENYDRLVENASGQTVGIAQADCPEDTEYLCSLLQRNNPPGRILTVEYEPVTGAHVGPGALALFFYGKKTFRDE